MTIEKNTKLEEVSILPETDQDQSESFVKKHWKKGVAILAGAALVGTGSAVGVNLANSAPEHQTNNSSEPFPSTTPDILPSETPQPEVLPTVESIAINPELLSNPEALATRYMELTTEWMNAGATPANYEKFANDSSISKEDFAKNLVASYDQIYKEALFGKQPSYIDTVNAYIDRLELTHYETILLYLTTTPSEYNLADKEPYTRGEQIVSFEVKDTQPDSLTMGVVAKPFDNSAQNRVGDPDFANAVDETIRDKWTVVWGVVNDSLVITKKAS